VPVPWPLAASGKLSVPLPHAAPRKLPVCRPLAAAAVVPVSLAMPGSGELPVRRSLPAAGRAARVTSGQRARQCRQQQRDRELMPLLGQVRHLGARHHDLEHAAIDLPVAELPGSPFLHAQVDDVQPVTEVVKHQARLAVVRPDGPRFPQRVELI
jgi:hypothetical protein